jgi:hypothetical protein
VIATRDIVIAYRANIVNLIVRRKRPSTLFRKAFAGKSSKLDA